MKEESPFTHKFHNLNQGKKKQKYLKKNLQFIDIHSNYCYFISK